VARLHTCYAPVRRSLSPERNIPLDLHVLGLPLAFILSQDQTLHCIKILNVCLSQLPKIKSTQSPKRPRKKFAICHIISKNFVLIQDSFTTLSHPGIPSKSCGLFQPLVRSLFQPYFNLFSTQPPVSLTPLSLAVPLKADAKVITSFPLFQNIF
jgi:hypothetical protein